MLIPISDTARHGRYRLLNARLPEALADPQIVERLGARDGVVAADILIEGEIVRQIRSTQGTKYDDVAIDLRRGMVWPTFVDIHTHIGRSHILPQYAAANGTIEQAIVKAVEFLQSAGRNEAMRRLLDFSLRSAYAHGTSAIRVHYDCSKGEMEDTWQVFRDTRAAWRDRIEMRAVSMAPLHWYSDDTCRREILAQVKKTPDSALGGAILETDSLDMTLPAVFDAATEVGCDIDLHVDETLKPGTNSLPEIARLAMERRFPGRITCGHCCALAHLPPLEMDRTLDLVAETGISLVALPKTNMHLQDRKTGRTPRMRGVLPIKEARRRSIPVAVASDNVRDPFYPFGDNDMLEVFRDAVRVMQLDDPIGAWADVVGPIPAGMMGLAEHGRIAEGLPADLLLFRGRTFSELLSRPHSDRIVLRRGQPIDTALPDYSELDDLFDDRPPVSVA